MPTLQSIGVHPQLREQLRALDPAIETPQALLSRDPASLARALGVPLQQIENVRTAVSDALTAKSPHGKRALQVAATVGNHNPFIVGAVTALDLCSYQQSLRAAATPAISTQSRLLDNLLAFPLDTSNNSGGIPYGFVTQVTGGPASGKTQVALSLAAQHAAESGKVYYLASGFGHGTLVPLVRRLQHFCTKTNFQKVVQNVNFVTVDNGHEALAALEQIEHERVLIILDSASGCLSGDLYASGTNANDVGVMLAHKVTQTLRRFARHSGAAVLVTNGTVSSEASGVKPAMGQAWHVADISLWFQVVSRNDAIMEEDTTGDKRIRATLVQHLAKSCHRPETVGERTVEFTITSSGIADVEEAHPMDQ